VTESRIRLAVDIGGTFTDVVVETARGRHTKKVLTTPAPEEGVMAGMLGVLAEAGLAVPAVEVIIHGTTLATNAIIERKGARTALIATEGFRDTLDIADEGRSASAASPTRGGAAGARGRPAGRRPVFDPESVRAVEVPLYWRPDLAPGDTLDGPAVIAEDETSTFLTARFRATINAIGCIVLERHA